MNLLEMIGKTPLVTLPSFSAELLGTTLLAKIEFMDPNGSVKDRTAEAMILDKIVQGLLTSDKTITNATSGNTGIAYAMVGAVSGYHVQLYLPQNTSPERKKIIRQYDVTVVETDPLEGSDGAYLEIQVQVAAHSKRYFYPDRYDNPANSQTHFATIGRKIWEQGGKQVTHLVIGMDTPDSFVGTARRLRFEDPRVKTLTVQPALPSYGTEGTKYMDGSIRPGILDETPSDDVTSVTTEETYANARCLARRDGILVGISSGTNVAAVAWPARMLPASSVVVTLLCDAGPRYLTDLLWNEAYD